MDILDHFYDWVVEKDPKKNEGPELVTKSAKVKKGSKLKGKKR